MLRGIIEFCALVGPLRHRAIPSMLVTTQVAKCRISGGCRYESMLVRFYGAGQILAQSKPSPMSPFPNSRISTC